jgi:UTP--glucose-1-phosphate uridylyltransferase
MSDAPDVLYAAQADTATYAAGDQFDVDTRLADAVARMAADGQPAVAIASFARAYRMVAAGDRGLIGEAQIEPVQELPDGEIAAQQAQYQAIGRQALGRVAVVKLNGGLGTSMGMRGPKSLVDVRPGISFLDVVARQVLALRRTSGTAIPLLLMDSFRTQAESLATLARYPLLDVGLPLDFLQHRVPRIDVDTLTAIDWPADPELMWCPPGHGDLYAALTSSGLLAALRTVGVRWLFVSNVDNLGATLDVGLLGWVVHHQASFMMEVADRTSADRKGGHLARAKSDGSLLLRERAQCPPGDARAFVDIARHRYFNTNNLWIDLHALADALTDGGGLLPLAPIVNRKHVDPADAASPEVFQLESAMGAAISVLPGARAVRVSRARFAPVKTTADLVALRSDRFLLDDDGLLVDCAETASLDVRLDDAAHDLDGFARCFPHGVPRIRRLRSLAIVGDVRFGRGVTLIGDVEIVADPGTTRWIADGATIDGDNAAVA